MTNFTEALHDHRKIVLRNINDLTHLAAGFRITGNQRLADELEDIAHNLNMAVDYIVERHGAELNERFQEDSKAFLETMLAAFTKRKDTKCTPT